MPTSFHQLTTTIAPIMPPLASCERFFNIPELRELFVSYLEDALTPAARGQSLALLVRVSAAFNALFLPLLYVSLEDRWPPGSSLSRHGHLVRHIRWFDPARKALLKHIRLYCPNLKSVDLNSANMVSCDIWAQLFGLRKPAITYTKPWDSMTPCSWWRHRGLSDDDSDDDENNQEIDDWSTAAPVNPAPPTAQDARRNPDIGVFYTTRVKFGSRLPAGNAFLSDSIQTLRLQLLLDALMDTIHWLTLAGKASRLQGLNKLVVSTYSSTGGGPGEPQVSSRMILDLVDAFPQLRKISFGTLVVSDDKDEYVGDDGDGDSNDGTAKEYRKPMQLTHLRIPNLRSAPALTAVLRNLSWPSSLTTLTVPDIPDSNKLLRVVRQYCPNLKSFALAGQPDSMSTTDLNWFLGQYPDMMKLTLMWCQVTDRDLEVISNTCADTQSLQKFEVFGRPRSLRRSLSFWSDGDADSGTLSEATTAAHSSLATWRGFKMLLSTCGRLQELEFRYGVNLPIEAFEYPASSTSMTLTEKVMSAWPCSRTLRVLNLGKVVLRDKDENVKFRGRLQDLVVLRQLCIIGKGITVEVLIDNREVVSMSENENVNQGKEDGRTLLTSSSSSQKEEPPHRYLCLEYIEIQFEEDMTVVELQRVLKAVPRLAEFNAHGRVQETAMEWLEQKGLYDLFSE